MKHLITTFILLMLHATVCRGAVGLEQCIDAAEGNYPAVAKYNLIALGTDINIDRINSAWYPRIGIYGQATAQNDVPSWPDAFSSIMSAMNVDARGLSRLQYKVGADVNQTIWDGGASQASRRIQRARSEVDKATLDVEIYALRERVINLYFGILLLEKQIDCSRQSLAVADENLLLLKSMVANGTATRSDAAMMEAQKLQMESNISEASTTAAGMRRMLGLLTGLDLTDENLELPSASMPDELTCSRPELNLLDYRLALNNASLEGESRGEMPRVSLFAQAYYGYPGLNYFESMMKRNMSFNIIGGVKISWNIDTFYTRRERRASTVIANESIQSDRNTFLLNNAIQSTELTAAAKKYQDMAATSGRIAELRREVRIAAQSRFKNGVLDIADLTSRISEENIAELTAAYHEIQAIQKIHQLKFTLNR